MSTADLCAGCRADCRVEAPAGPAAILVAPVLSREEMLRWLHKTDPDRLAELWRLANAVRSACVGDQVHLRGLIEISNHCVRQCGYCGLRAGNRDLVRYRMTADEIVGCAYDARVYGYGTVVLQAGEDYGLKTDWVSGLGRRSKAETGLAVTLSLGERGEDELREWKEAGADRYLLRFETSDERLYEHIHPSLPGRVSDRLAMLRLLAELGYEVGSGVMVGVPGQTYASLVSDIELFRSLDLDMIGIGPYIAHPATPLGEVALAPAGPAGCAAGAGAGTADPPLRTAICAADQAPNDELTVYKMLALTRLACPRANIPSTTALATINKESGRELGLQRGANIVMPNLTPPKYRVLYEIYPDKACINETAEMCRGCLTGRIESIGRHVGTGAGGRARGRATAGSTSLSGRTAG